MIHFTILKRCGQENNDKQSVISDGKFMKIAKNGDFQPWQPPFFRKILENYLLRYGSEKL